MTLRPALAIAAILAAISAAPSAAHAAASATLVAPLNRTVMGDGTTKLRSRVQNLSASPVSSVEFRFASTLPATSCGTNNYDFPLEQQVTTPAGWTVGLFNADRVRFDANSAADQIADGASLDFDLRVTGNAAAEILRDTVNRSDCFDFVIVTHADTSVDSIADSNGPVWTRHGFHLVLEATPSSAVIGAPVTVRYLVSNRTSSATAKTVVSTPAAPATIPAGAATGPAGTTPASLSLGLDAAGEMSWTGTIATGPSFRFQSQVSSSTGGTTTSPVTTSNEVAVGTFTSQLAVIPGEWVSSAQPFTLELTVKNNGTVALGDVRPSADPASRSAVTNMVFAGSASVAYQSGPLPASVPSLAPGQSATFRWTYAASGTPPATLFFQGGAIANGTPNVTALASSNTVELGNYSFNVLPPSIARGETGPIVFQAGQGLPVPIQDDFQLRFPLGFTMTSAVPPPGYDFNIAGQNVNFVRQNAGVQWDPGEILDFGVVFSPTGVPNPPGGTDRVYLVDFRLVSAGVLTKMALLVTENRLAVSAAPASLPADGASTSLITATLTNSGGAGIGGATVNFDTTAGTLSAASAVTNGSGVATVTLTAPTSSTTVTGTVSASRYSNVDTTTVTFTGVVGQANLLYVGGTLYVKNIAPNTSYAFSIWVENVGDTDAVLGVATTTFDFGCLDPAAVPLTYTSNLAAPTTVPAGALAQLSFAATSLPDCDPTPTQSVFPSFTYNPTRSIGDTLNIQPAPTFASVVDLAVEPAGDGARLTWSTELEYDNLGFRILRADGAGEPEYLDVWVPASGAMFGSYEALDLGPLPEGLHAWWVEDVDVGGASRRHGPVFLGFDGTAGAPESGVASGGPAAFGARVDPAVWDDPLDDGSIRVLARDEDAITWEIVPPAYTVEVVPFPVALLDRIRIPGWSALQEPGEPDLPVRHLEVSVPRGTIASLEIVSVDETTVAGIQPTWDAGAVPPPDEAVVTIAQPNAGFARLGAPDVTFPSEVASLDDLGWMGERRVVTLAATPLRFDFTRGELRVASRIVVRVSFRADGAAGSVPVPDATLETQARVLAGPALEVSVNAPGLVRVPLADLAAAGVAPATAGVWRRGVLVPSRIEGAELVFAAQEVPESPWSRTHSWWIAEGTGSTLPLGTGAPVTGASIDLARRRLHVEGDTWFAPLSVQGEGADRWFWTRIFTGGPLSATVPVTVPAVDPTVPASLSLELKGLYDDPYGESEHLVRVRLNGADLGAVALAAFERRHVPFAVPPGVLVAGANTLEIASESTLVTSVALDSADLEWTAAADAGGGNELAVVAIADGTLTAGGFAAPAAFALDETVPALLAVSSEADGLGGFRASVEATAGHSVRFVTAAAASPATWAARDAFDVLASAGGADFIVIAASPLVDAAAGFAAYRASEAGGRFRTAVIDAGDLYDRFTFGDVDPDAARLFLAHARAHWPAPAPRYVLLVGDSDADPLDHLGTGVAGGLLLSERLDTEVLNVASDSLTAAFLGGDAIPDVALGRIPAKDAAGVEAALAKTLSYEAAPRDGWDARETLFSDDDLPEFGGVREELAGLLPLGMTADDVSASDLGDTAARDSLLQSLEGGSALATYVGHGGVTTFGAEPYLATDDVPVLSSGRYPVVLAVDCMNGYFDHPYFDAVSEELVLHPGAGAVAFFGSSAVTRDTGHRDLAVAFHHAFWREPDLRLGDVAMRAYAAVAWRADAPDLIGSFVLLGDPALRLNVDGTPAAVAQLASVGPGTAFLSGAASRDPEGAPLAFQWEIVEGEAGASLDDSASASPVLTGPAGRYRVRLRVADAHRASPPDELVVELRHATPSDGGSRGVFGCSVAGVSRAMPGAGGLLFLGLAAAFARRRHTSP